MGFAKGSNAIFQLIEKQVFGNPVWFHAFYLTQPMQSSIREQKMDGRSRALLDNFIVGNLVLPFNAQDPVYTM